MNRPDSFELLVTAREVLMGEVLPEAPAHLRYELRMIASAMAIAAREVKFGEGIVSDEGSLLSSVLPEHCRATPLDAQREALAKAIRRGDFDEDGSPRERVREVLRKVTMGELSVSNPKAVAAMEARDASGEPS